MRTTAPRSPQSEGQTHWCGCPPTPVSPHNNYRCVYRSNYPGDVEHPRSLSVAESRVLPPLDMWLGRMFDPDHIDETIDRLLSLDQRIDADPPSVVEARRLAADAQARLERHIAAINAGFEPSLLVSDTRQAQTDLAKANGILAAHTARNTPAVLTPAMIRSVLLRHRGLPGLLRDVATPDERRQLYAGLGLSLAFERRIINGEIKELFRPSFQAVGGRGVTLRVGGATRSFWYQALAFASRSCPTQARSHCRRESQGAVVSCFAARANDWLRASPRVGLRMKRETEVNFHRPSCSTIWGVFRYSSGSITGSSTNRWGGRTCLSGSTKRIPEGWITYSYRWSRVKYAGCGPPSKTSSVATQAIPPGTKTLLISRTAWLARSWPPKCSMELSE